MRNDCTIDGRAVLCPNASLIGYGKARAQVGDFVVYGSDYDNERLLARMLGRVTYLENVNGRVVENRAILGMVLSDTGAYAFERWIDPAHVRRVTAAHPGNAAFAAVFFAEKLPYDVRTMRRLIEHGTMSDRYVGNMLARVAEWKARETFKGE